MGLRKQLHMDYPYFYNELRLGACLIDTGGIE